MIELYDSETGAAIGRITDEQFSLLEDHLEEESETDEDYYFNAATVDLLEDEGADPALAALLRRALGDRQGVELRWERVE